MLPRVTRKEKLAMLKKAWGYVEVTQATIKASRWKIWLVKNYSGKPIQHWEGTHLPGNPKATRKIECTGYREIDAINRAISSLKRTSQIRAVAR